MKQERALDADIARFIFKCVIVINVEQDDYFLVDAKSKKQRPVAQFSTKIDNAYQIIQHLQSLGYLFEVRNNIDNEGNVGWLSVFHKAGENPNIWYKADALPLCICYAAMGLATPKT
jgi:hypothetical protein